MNQLNSLLLEGTVSDLSPNPMDDSCTFTVHSMLDKYGETTQLSVHVTGNLATRASVLMHDGDTVRVVGRLRTEVIDMVQCRAESIEILHQEWRNV